MLYFAYGSNLHVERMLARCPRARRVGKFYLPDARLVFRGVADCIYAPGEKCPGAIWSITSACERELDIYEGIRHGLYRKEYLPIADLRNGETELMVYVMNSTGVFPPSQGYALTIAQGYKDFRLPLRYLAKAIKNSWDDKAPTDRERARYARAGNPELLRI